MLTEQKMIDRIARAIPSTGGAWLRLGIGDDAAILRVRPRHELVLSCDPFLEGIHFLDSVHPPEAAGFKALARAASDLAAMGAAPKAFLLGLSLPANRTGGWLDRFLAGMARAARRLGIILVGGDVSIHSSVLVHITVAGEISPGRALTRKGARPGDAIFISGTLGRAQLGLELILRDLHKGPRWKHLLEPHFYPEPRLKLGCWLAEHRAATAAIDTSDGLSTDLVRICEASGVGARVDAQCIPTFVVPDTLRGLGLDPLALALHGGEDYELLFTVPPRLARKLPASCGGVPLTRIGVMTRARGVYLEAQTGRVALPPRGWDHFRKKSG